MNAWLLAGLAIGAGLIPCAFLCLRGSPERRLVGLEMTSVLAILMLAMFSVGFGRPSLIDLPLVLSMLSFGGGLIFARFLEKHL